MAQCLKWWLITSLIVAGIVSGCGSIDGTTIPPVDPSSPTYNPPPGVVDNSAGFYVDYVKSAKYTYVNHKGNATITTKCTSDAGELSLCFTEAQELDLYFNGVSMQYNVPSSMCSYFEVWPYYFYKWQPGAGPAFVQADTDAAGAVGVDTNSDGAVDATVAICPYDYTTIKGPNCCTGTYTKVTRTWVVDPASGNGSYVVSSTVSNVEWGGDLSTCIAGPAVETQPKNQANFPVPVLYYVEGAGINGIYTVKAPIASLYNTDLYAANYFPGAETAGAPPSAMTTTQPYYDFICLSRTHEVKSQIRMFVRKWNTGPEFDNMLADPSAYAVTGMENAPWATQPNDDWWGWVHFLATYPMFGL